MWLALVPEGATFGTDGPAWQRCQRPLQCGLLCHLHRTLRDAIWIHCVMQFGRRPCMQLPCWAVLFLRERPMTRIRMPRILWMIFLTRASSKPGWAGEAKLPNSSKMHSGSGRNPCAPSIACGCVRNTNTLVQPNRNSSLAPAKWRESTTTLIAQWLLAPMWADAVPTRLIAP